MNDHVAGKDPVDALLVAVKLKQLQSLLAGRNQQDDAGKVLLDLVDPDPNVRGAWQNADVARTDLLQLLHKRATGGLGRRGIVRKNVAGIRVSLGHHVRAPLDQRPVKAQIKVDHADLSRSEDDVSHRGVGR